jgi:hypothetical protein
VRLPDGTISRAEVHWYEAHGVGRRELKLKHLTEETRLKTPNKSSAFVLCVKNDGYPASLETRKIYRVLPDSDATRHHLIRVIDESGEDYLYPADFFIAIELPKAVKQRTLFAS